MKNYAKLIDGRLEWAPHTIKEAGYTISNPSSERLAALGFKPVVYDAQPTAEGSAIEDSTSSGSEAEGSVVGTPAAEYDTKGSFPGATSVREVYTEEADCIRVGWEACATAPEPALGYEQRVEALIRERYTVSDELALLRQREAKAAEFEVYFAFCEQCKALARDKPRGYNEA